MPARLLPSLTSTKASVFCLRNVRTQPLIVMGLPSFDGWVQSHVLMRGAETETADAVVVEVEVEDVDVDVLEKSRC